MLIIDRYVLRQFIKMFLICYVSLTGLYVVFDAFTNLEEFMRSSEGAAGLFALLGSFYGYQSIVFFDRTAGLLALTAATFTVSWIQQHNELTALMAAGISRIRVVRPIIVATVVIVLLAAATREIVIPRFRDQLSRRPQNLVGDVGQALQPHYDHRTNILIRGKHTFVDQKRIEAPNFLLPRSLHYYAKQLVAENAFYRPPQQGRPGGYLLDNVSQPKDIDTRESLRLGDQPLVLAPRDAPDWLEPNQCFVVSDIRFDQLTDRRAFKQFSSTAQLIAGLHNSSLDFGADVRVAIHSRIVNPLMDVTLMFLGLPLIVSRKSRNVFLAIGMCLGVVTLFLLVVIGFQHLGSIYLLDPALAAWGPLILFVPVAVYLAESMWH